jgi:hypothetical protein
MIISRHVARLLLVIFTNYKPTHSLRFNTSCQLTEEKVVADVASEEEYVSIIAHDAAYFIDLEDKGISYPLAMPGLPIESANKLKKRPEVGALKFVPYYFRANRDGRGHMRVGLQIARDLK